jgi:outer membrane immunogenic protein
MRRRAFLAALVAAAGGLCAPAARADGLVVKPSDPYVYVAPDALPLVYDWTGIYIGGHLGLANSAIDWTYTDGVLFEDFSHVATGFTGGGFAGLQKQWSWLVLGAEVGYLWLDQPESTNSVNFADTTATSDVRNLLLVTGKFGWAYDNILAYFKGGWASADVDFRTRQTSTGALLTSSSERESGWTAGAGLEYALWQHVILGVEYNYIHFGTDTRAQVPTAIGPAGTTMNGEVDIQSVTARLSFKLGPRPEVLPAK